MEQLNNGFLIFATMHLKFSERKTKTKKQNTFKQAAANQRVLNLKPIMKLFCASFRVHF